MTLHSPTPGSRFGRYVLDERIGMGGMGVVFRATDTHLNRTIALKVMAGRLAGNDEFTQRFEREADVMARLDSPHVITILDHGVEDGVPWIATQFVPGGDLGGLLAREEGLDLATAARVCAQIAEALGDAHRAGVIHRDVKPSNVLLRDADFDARGLDPFVYLCDFGIAHTGTTGLTQTGGVAGSWAWLAPERTQGDPGTVRSDIYALGCVLWATLTGRAPYAGSDVEVALAQVQQPVPQFAGDDPATSRVNAVLARAMAKDPAHRYASAHEFRADLLGLTSYGARTLVAPDPRTGRTTGTGTQVRALPGSTPTRDRRRRWVPVAGVAAVAVLGSAAYAGWRLADDEPTEDPEPVAIQGDVDGDGRGDLVTRWFNWSDDYKEGRNFLHASNGAGFDEPERRAQPEGYLVRGDVDGDGLDDVVGVDDNLETSGLDVTVIGNDGEQRTSSLGKRGKRDDSSPVLADVDGDGRDDLVLTWPRESGTNDADLVIEVARSTGDGFAEPTDAVTLGNWSSYGEQIVAGDVEGDGRDDLVVRRTRSGQSPQLRVMRSDGSGFEAPGPPRDTPENGVVMTPLDVADVDGDGVDEVVTYVRGAPGTVQVHDFDAETGGLTEGADWLSDPVDDPEDAHEISLADLDGDGRADLVLQRSKTTTHVAFDVALSTGSSFEAPANWAEVTCLNKGCDEDFSMLANNIT